MNRLDGAGQAERRLQLFEGQIRLFGQERAELAAMPVVDFRFAPSAVMQRCDVPDMPPLLDEFFDHPVRNSEALSDLLLGVPALVVGLEDAFAEIDGESLFAHGHTLPDEPPHRQ